MKNNLRELTSSAGRVAIDLHGHLPAAGRRPVTAAVGLALLLPGILMLVLPGPGLLLVALGLAVLALEFSWVRRLLSAAGRRVARAGSSRESTG